MTVKNTGSTAIIISDAYLGSTSVTAQSDIDLVDGLSIAANTIETVTIDPTVDFVQGQSYQFKLVTSKGNPFVYTATAPL